MSPMWGSARTDAAKVAGAGKRNREVTVEAAPSADAAGSTGFPIQAWTSLVTGYWCSRVDFSGGENFGAGQEAAQAETRWEGPYLEELDPELVNVPKLRRLVHEGRVYDIVSAAVIGQRAGIEFITLAKVG